MPAERAATFRLLKVPSAEFIFGSTAAMRELREQIERAIHDDLPILLEGESGTGKEMIAQFVHTHSARREGPFFKLNCAAVPAGLLEGDLLGNDVDGSINVCESGGESGGNSAGTVFLDEINNLDLRLQSKLSAVLKSREYEAMASWEGKRVKGRYVGSTNVGIEAASRHGTFSRELLSCFTHRMHLLPLRERKGDIPELCEYLLVRFAREFGRPVPHLSSYVLEAFQQWRWPGNVRELENWIARIVIFGAEEVIDPDFSRQLLASEEQIFRSHHVVKMKMGKARRLRRHG